MKYIAIPLEQKPFLYWQSYEGPDTPLTITGEPPLMEFGVYPVKIVADALVTRSEGEMADFEAAYNIEQALKSYASKVDVLANEHFVWGGWNFPMFENARLFYDCINHTPANYKVMDTTSVLRDVLVADNAAFITAYYSALKLIVQPS